MAISERELKVLWGRAAGRCAVCKISVTEDKRSINEAYPFGETAHIVAEKPGGPRGNGEYPESLLNSYLNLILLCPNCHTKVDKAPEDFSVEKLLQLKQEHEAEVSQFPRADKDSYDEVLSFSSVTEENWLSPDRKNYIPFGIPKEQWIAPFLQPKLESRVPKKVVQAFEVARACMIYSWFFYPLATLGLEQLMRVGKLAVQERCLGIQIQPEKEFSAELKMLVATGVLTPAVSAQWEAMGRLTDDRTFLAGPTLMDPGQGIGTLQLLARLINELFLKVNTGPE